MHSITLWHPIFSEKWLKNHLNYISGSKLSALCAYWGKDLMYSEISQIFNPSLRKPKEINENIKFGLQFESKARTLFLNFLTNNKLDFIYTSPYTSELKLEHSSVLSTPDGIVQLTSKSPFNCFNIEGKIPFELKCSMDPLASKNQPRKYYMMQVTLQMLVENSKYGFYILYTHKFTRIYLLKFDSILCNFILDFCNAITLFNTGKCTKKDITKRALLIRKRADFYVQNYQICSFCVKNEF